MNTLLRFIEANGLNSQTIESLPASELDHLLSILFLFLFLFLFFYERKQEKWWREYESATVSSSQRNIQRYLSEKKYPFNILKVMSS